MREFENFEALDLTFVVMAYNEEGSLGDTVEACLDWMRSSRKVVQVLIMEDGSEDRTPEIADDLARTYENVEVYHQPVNKGQFNNLRTCWGLVETKYYAAIPGDNQFDLSNFDLFCEFIGRYDVVFGFPNNEEVRGRSRVLMSYMWRLYLLTLYGFPITYLGGLVIVPVDLVRRLDIQSGHFLGWYETALQICISGATYLQIPFEMRDRSTGESKSVNPVRNLADLARMARIWRRIKGPGFLKAGRQYSVLRKTYQDFKKAATESSVDSSPAELLH